MTGKTHLALGTVTVLAGLSAADGLIGGGRLPAPALAGLVLVGAIASLVPDLDSPESELQHAPHKLARALERAVPGRRSLAGGLVRLTLGAVGGLASALIGVLATAIQSLTPHRGWTHSLAGWGITTGGVALVAAEIAALRGAVGTPALLAPAAAVGGVWALGWASHLLADAATPHGVPLRAGRPWHLLPAGHRVRTGTWPDTLVARWGAWAGVGLLLVLDGRLGFWG